MEVGPKEPFCGQIEHQVLSNENDDVVGVGATYEGRDENRGWGNI